jgi:hypothetical protein
VPGQGVGRELAVCYCLGITEVDPQNGNALFERFVSKERDEPPDIDVDFEHERREEVIQYIYRKYGRERAALAATVIRYKARSAVRDLGKALGLSLSEVDRLSKTLSWWDDRSELPDRVREAGFDPQRLEIRHLLALDRRAGGLSAPSVAACRRLRDIARAARGTGAGGERGDGKAHRDPVGQGRPGIPGLLKVDVLALGMLTGPAPGDGLHRLEKLQDIPKEDPLVYGMIQKADTIGVFQIESRAQMSMLPRLKPKEFLRPGDSGRDRAPGADPGRHGASVPAPAGREGTGGLSERSGEGVLQRTLGIPIFQEQVMRLAIVAAGFTADEADQLRRAMAAWKKKGGLEPFEKKLKDGMALNGYAAQFADQIYRQILGSANTAFRSRTPPASRCLRTTRPGSSATIPRLSSRPAEQPADGLLPAFAAGAGREEARRGDPLRGRNVQPVGLHAGGQRGRRRERRRGAPRAAHGGRIWRGCRQEGRRKQASCLGGGSRAARRTEPQGPEMPGGGGRLAKPCRAPQERALGRFRVEKETALLSSAMEAKAKSNSNRLRKAKRSWPITRASAYRSGGIRSRS